MKLLLALGLAGAVMPTGSAHAADLYLSQPQIVFEAAPQFDWTGFYAGLNGGYGWGDADTLFGELDPKGWLLGAQAGYNYAYGGFVLGAEADIQWTDMDGSFTTVPGGTTVTADLEAFGTVRGRAGLALDRLMPYITGGLAYGNMHGTTTFGPGYVTDEWVLGWTAGTGIEYAATDNILVRAEYLYVDFGPETYFAGTPREETVSSNFGTARLGVSFKF